MENKLEQPSYYAVIPASVRYDGRLCPNDKLLFAEISALTNKAGFCWAANSYFARLYDVSITSVSKWVSQLLAAGHITVEMIYEDGSKEIQCRKISLVKPAGVLNENLIGIKQKLNTPMKEKLKGGIKEKFKDNNTSTNTTSINKEESHSASVEKKDNYVFNEGRDYWLNTVHPGWSFNGVQGKALKSIIIKIQGSIEQTGADATNEKTIEAFKILMQALPDWFKDKELNVIDTKYNEIISQIKSNKHGNANHHTQKRSYGDSVFA